MGGEEIRDVSIPRRGGFPRDAKRARTDRVAEVFESVFVLNIYSYLYVTEVEHLIDISRPNPGVR